MMAYRIVLLAVATLAFVTLYDHGPANFPANASAELTAFSSWVQSFSGH